MDLQAAIRTLADAMRPNDSTFHTHARRGLHEELPDAERGGDDRPLRPIGYINKRPAAVTQQRAANAAEQPLRMRPVLLAKPEKKAGAQ